MEACCWELSKHLSVDRLYQNHRVGQGLGNTDRIWTPSLTSDFLNQNL